MSCPVRCTQAVLSIVHRMTSILLNVFSGKYGTTQTIDIIIEELPNVPPIYHLPQTFWGFARTTRDDELRCIPMCRYYEPVFVNSPSMHAQSTLGDGQHDARLHALLHCNWCWNPRHPD